MSCAAQWAGYNWDPWRRNTSGLTGVSTPVYDNDDVEVGNIMDEVGSHVRSIYARSGTGGNTVIDMIGAEGAPTSKVTYVNGRNLNSEKNGGYVAMHLDPN